MMDFPWRVEVFPAAGITFTGSLVAFGPSAWEPPLELPPGPQDAIVTNEGLVREIGILYKKWNIPGGDGYWLGGSSNGYPTISLETMGEMHLPLGVGWRLSRVEMY